MRMDSSRSLEYNNWRRSCCCVVVLVNKVPQIDDSCRRPEMVKKDCGIDCHSPIALPERTPRTNEAIRI